MVLVVVLGSQSRSMHWLWSGLQSSHCLVCASFRNTACLCLPVKECGPDRVQFDRMRTYFSGGRSTRKDEMCHSRIQMGAAISTTWHVFSMNMELMCRVDINEAMTPKMQ
ncbi:unnamed protein product [Dicrocoelium dendriticum]|nr:unnamed protein product [Dicrocoelium dendriticum]